MFLGWRLERIFFWGGATTLCQFCFILRLVWLIAPAAITSDTSLLTKTLNCNIEKYYGLWLLQHNDHCPVIIETTLFVLRQNKQITKWDALRLCAKTYSRRRGCFTRMNAVLRGNAVFVKILTTTFVFIRKWSIDHCDKLVVKKEALYSTSVLRSAQFPILLYFLMLFQLHGASGHSVRLLVEVESSQESKQALL